MSLQTSAVISRAPSVKAEHITRTSLLAKFSLSHLQEVARVLASYNLHSSDSPLETLPNGDKKERYGFQPKHLAMLTSCTRTHSWDI